MTDEQYRRAVDALAALIVRSRAAHPAGDLPVIDGEAQPASWRATTLPRRDAVQRWDCLRSSNPRWPAGGLGGLAAVDSARERGLGASAPISQKLGLFCVR